MDNLIIILGILAGLCTTFSLVPQIIKTHKTRHTADLSLGMFCLLALGVALWSVYGFLIGALPIIVANATSLILVIYIIAMKIKHG